MSGVRYGPVNIPLGLFTYRRLGVSFAVPFEYFRKSNHLESLKACADSNHDGAPRGMVVQQLMTRLNESDQHHVLCERLERDIMGLRDAGKAEVGNDFCGAAVLNPAPMQVFDSGGLDKPRSQKRLNRSSFPDLYKPPLGRSSTP